LITVSSQVIRLQKFLAERGVASRRTSAKYIADRRVRVNGRIVTEPGIHVNPEKDTVMFDNRIIPGKKGPLCTIMLYKPRGYICSTSSKDGRTIYELIKEINERLVPVGRLDNNSEGLLLISNDGGLVNRLTHPRFEQEKAYRVTVSGTLDSSTLKILRSPLLIDGHRIRAAEVRILRKGDNSQRFILEFILKEGRKRQIRRMCRIAELRIHRLVRVRIKNLTLTGLNPGQWRYLNSTEIDELRED